MAANGGGGVEQRAAPTLAADFHEAELADLAPLHARAVHAERVLHALFHGAVVLALVHVDEVDHDQPREIAQAHLARHLVGGLQIGFERGALHVALFGGAARVHVHAHQRLGGVDDQIAAGLQLHGRIEAFLDLVLDAIFQKQRHVALVLLHVLGVGGHQELDEAFGGLVGLGALDQHLFDVLVVEVAQRAFDQVALLVDQGGGDRLHGGVADVVPELSEIVVVALDVGLGALGARRAHDHAHALWHVEIVHDLFEALAVCGRGDLAADAAAARRVGHEHAVAPGEAQIGGERRALVAALFLDRLHQEDLAALDDFLDLVAATIDALAAFGGHLDLFVGDLGVVFVRRVALVGVEVFVLLDLVVIVFGRDGRFLLLEGEPVFVRDLVVVGVDFRKGQKAVPVAAEVHKGRLERGLHARDFGEIDVAAQLALGGGFEV